MDSKEKNSEREEVLSATDEEVMLADKMADCLLKIWKLVIPVAAGWLLLMLGFSIMSPAIDLFFIGFLLMLGGLALIPLPTVTMVWSGCSLKEAFNTEYFIETTYADGHKTVDYDLTGTAVSKFIVLALAFVLGYIITPIRVFIGIIAFVRAKKKLGIKKLPLKEDVLLPLIVTVGAFVVGIIMSVCIVTISDAIYEQQQHTSDYTVEQRDQIVADWKTAWKTADFTYQIHGAYEQDGNKCDIKVEKEGESYTFIVSAASYYSSDVGGFAYYEESQSPVPFGTYEYTNGWASEVALSDAQKALLESCTVESYLNKVLSYNPILKNKSLSDQDGYLLIAYADEVELRFEIYKDSSLPYRIFGAGDIYGLVGGYDIMFE